MKAHPDRSDSLGQPAVHGTFEALREFQRARYGLDDERRVALGTGHAFFGDSRFAIREGKMNIWRQRPTSFEILEVDHEKSYIVLLTFSRGTS